jgi:4-hydroxy-tetrahydrodipicolinate synthase
MRTIPNVCLLKGEAPAHVIAQLVDDTAGVFRVFNGRGGLELTDSLRAGCAGVIPAPECFDVQVRIYDALRAGRDDEAERLYRDIAPLITFMMSSLDTFHLLRQADHRAAARHSPRSSTVRRASTRARSGFR